MSLMLEVLGLFIAHNSCKNNCVKLSVAQIIEIFGCYLRG